MIPICSRETLCASCRLVACTWWKVNFHLAWCTMQSPMLTRQHNIHYVISKQQTTTKQLHQSKLFSILNWLQLRDSQGNVECNGKCWFYMYEKNLMWFVHFLLPHHYAFLLSFAPNTLSTYVAKEKSQNNSKMMLLFHLHMLFPSNCIYLFLPKKRHFVVWKYQHDYREVLWKCCAFVFREKRFENAVTWWYVCFLICHF